MDNEKVKQKRLLLERLRVRGGTKEGDKVGEEQVEVKKFEQEQKIVEQKIITEVSERNDHHLHTPVGGAPEVI